MKSNNRLYELEVLVNGRPATEYLYREKMLFEGQRGSEYKLRIRNNGRERIAIVLSVDGLSIMNGKTASKDDRAYVIGPCETMDIPGWRLDNRAVASFLFGTLPESYAARMGKPDNIGVIGAAFYQEIPKRPVHTNEMYGDAPQMMGSIIRGGEAPMTKSIGTGFGREQQHEVSSTSFDRQPLPVETLTLYYDDAAGLEARGIILASHYKKESDDPVLKASAFPADGCIPPAGW
jgi:hypothetical protein